MASKYDIPAGIFDFIYNGGLDVAKKNYATSADALQAFLDNYAANYPTFKKTMQAEGMLNADGSINPKKFMDSDYLNAVKQQASEGLISSAGSAVKNARMNQAATGGAGSNVQTAGIAKSVGEVARNLARDYGGAYKQEKETAYAKGVDFGSRTQDDAIKSALVKYQALENDRQTAGEVLAQQQPGILQDPNVIRDLAGMGISALIGNPAGVISSGMNMFGRGKSSAHKKTILNQEGGGEADLIQGIPEYYLKQPEYTHGYTPTGLKKKFTRYGIPVNFGSIYSD